MRVDIGWPAGLMVAGLLSLYAVVVVPLNSALPWLSRPEGGTEIATAAAFLTAAFVAGRAAWHADRPTSLWLGLWAVLAVVFFGEETSWLQHFFGYRTPAFLSELNVQGEANLHNLWFLQDGDLMRVEGLAGIASALTKSQNLFRLGFVGFFLIFPLLALASVRVARAASRWGPPYPSARFLVVIWVPILVTVALTGLTDDRLGRFAAAETRELCYAVTILVYVIVTARAAAVTPAALPAEPPMRG